MESTYNHKAVEDQIYRLWEEGGYFTPRIDHKKKPFTIILPLPNANDPMHVGHAMFTIQDILARYHRMAGNPTLWLPGGDHAGIETQYVFEKHLAKEGKSRFDFDRNTLYRMIWDFAEKNKSVNRDQMKRLGFSLDWSRYHYSLEPEIVEMVLNTFRQLHADGLVYRDERLVNFCTRCGTAFSDLEIKYVERQDPLYYLKYGPFVLATTRPETKFGDTAVAFHPGDKRYEKYLGKEIEIKGINGSFKVVVIADDAIDPEFGTGIEKITPAHDFLDNEIAKRHNLPIKKVIDLSGRLTSLAGRFAGMKVNAARQIIVEEMQKMGLIDHIDEAYTHNVATCYKCGTTIEPLLTPQWYLQTKPLAKPAIQAVKKGVTKIIPKKRFEKMYFDWMENIIDWNISRQIVWGPRIPAWYCLECNPNLQLNFIDKAGNRISGNWQDLKTKSSFEEINAGLQSILAGKDASYQLHAGPCDKCQGSKTLQETDTFDTWFLSGQWPINTLSVKPGDFEYFYPTSVLDTMWDILFFWVGRMMMFGLYRTKKAPFETVHLHARVVDKEGKKMSKSKGNVLDPLLLVDRYGADALRMALVLGVAPGSDVALSEEKIKGFRNFSNKLWNIGRFLSLAEKREVTAVEDAELKKTVSALAGKTTKNLDNFKFGTASEELYQFAWHEFADKYVEDYKKGLISYAVLLGGFLTLLKLLHPFMPFVTEAIWQQMPRQKADPLIISAWPTA
jgi:valyl-tRNA synthetase